MFSQLKSAVKSKGDTKTASRGSDKVSVAIGAFSALSGVLLGYDTGTISGILAMDYVLERFPRDLDGKFSSTENGLIVAILSLGTFVGAIVTPLASDSLGRRWCVIIGSLIVFQFGVVLQTASTGIDLLVAGRFFAGFGAGIIAAVIPLYQSETAPKHLRGAIVSAYQAMFAFGLVIATIVVNSTHNRNDSGSYRIPIAVQFSWALVLGIGFILLPETPRYHVTRDNKPEALKVLSLLRSLPVDAPEIESEYLEIKANYDYEISLGASGWKDVFSKQDHQRKRIITGVVIQAFQQLCGINFIFYYGVTFFKNAGIKNGFVISIVCNVINLATTIPGMACYELYGRRPVMLIGAVGMAVSDFIVSITSVAAAKGDTANNVMIAFICIFIGFFGFGFGPGVWVICGEIFPLKVRAKSMGLSTASNWIWNFAIGYATPYLVDSGPGNAGLGAKVYFIWGGFNIAAVFFVYFMIYETKGLKLEQVDDLYNTEPRAWRSAKYNKVLRSEVVEEEEAFEGKEDNMV